MKNRKNKRTLKKRIRRIMSLSAFITVVFLSGFIIAIVIIVSKELTSYQANTVCKEIQQEINSGDANSQLGIENIEDLSSDNQFTKIWIDRVIKNTLIYKFQPYSIDSSKIFVEIEINNSVVYSNYNVKDEITNLYDDTQAENIIVDDTHNNQIGTIKVMVNPEAILPIVAVILVIVIIVSIFALIVAKIVSMFLIIPIINPLNQLEKKVKALADGDNETALHTQLVLKKPLREIESLANSTNDIMLKLHDYTGILEKQNKTLENQYLELEEQNDELTKSKQQIENQQAQLIQSEKMASVGLLTAAITHEINTPIGAINSNAQLSDMLLQGLAVHQEIVNDEELFTLFNQLKEANDINLMACSRIIEIIKSLKSFSRLDQAEYQEADINEGIKSILVLTNNLLKNRITVLKDFGDFPSVKCFPGQLNQVFMNVIVNASQAMEGEGELFIKTYQQEKFIYIIIRDTGSGIAPENIPKIFDPGFTTKGVGIGLGIGLYLSYNIIQNHKGKILVKSELGKGTEFTIKIPCNNDKT